MPLFRKRPVEVEARQFRGITSGQDIQEWAALADPPVYIRLRHAAAGTLSLRIPTLEGEMTAVEGDWIIRGVHGEFYPCRRDIFEKTYESV